MSHTSKWFTAAEILGEKVGDSDSDYALEPSHSDSESGENSSRSRSIKSESEASARILYFSLFTAGLRVKGVYKCDSQRSDLPKVPHQQWEHSKVWFKPCIGKYFLRIKDKMISKLRNAGLVQYTYKKKINRFWCKSCKMWANLSRMRSCHLMGVWKAQWCTHWRGKKGCVDTLSAASDPGVWELLLTPRLKTSCSSCSLSGQSQSLRYTLLFISLSLFSVLPPCALLSVWSGLLARFTRNLSCHLLILQDLQ